MALTDAQKELCGKWVAAPNRKWQTLNRSQWKYQFHEKTLVRYVEEAKMDEDIVPLLLEYLVSEDCKATLQLYGQGIGPDWAPYRAWYEVSNKAVGNVRSVRLYHALSTDVNGADGPYIVENGCAYRVEWTYYWKCPTVQTVPASTSGVSYHITNLQRDPETGLFSYAIEKRERVQQDIAEYLTSRTVYQDTKEEVHLGVKGANSVGGKSASVGGGKTVTRKVTKNQDCTHDVHNVTTEDKPVSDAAVSKSETVFETRTTTEDRNQASAASMSLTPGKSVRTEKTQSGLHNNTVTQTVEKPVSDAVVEYARTLHGTQKSVTHRNQSTPVSDDGMKVGERRATRKTDGGNNDNTIVTQVVEPAGKVAHGEAKTIFEDSESDRENVAADGELPEREAEEAGGGKTHSVDVRLNEDGTADVTNSEKQEKPVQDAAVEVRKTLRGVVRSVTDRNQPEPLELDPEDMAVGETRATRKTAGGLHDNTRSTVTAAAPGKIAKSCEKSAAAHTDAETKVVRAEDAEAELDHVDEPEVNTVVEKAVRKNEDGQTADVTTRTRKLKRQEGSGESKSGTGEIHTKTTRIENDEQKGELDEGGVNRQVEVSNTPNGAGGFNVVKSTTTFKPSDTREITLRVDDTTEHVFRSFRNQESYEGLLPSDDTPGHKNLSITKNTHGSWDGGYSITKPRTVAGYGIRIIEEGKDETFACGIRYGRWDWTNNMNVTGYITRAWEYRRFCTMKVRYTGLTSEAADQLKRALDNIFNRTVYGSLWEPNAMPGYFYTDVVGQMRMAKVVKYHMTGNLYGVLLDVNESSSRLSTSRMSAASMFSYENNWSYDVPAGGENV